MTPRTICAVTGFVLLATLPAAAETWRCSAPGLVSASYDGGSTAYVHLSGFSSGGNYAVVKKGKVATGTTQNGTTFTCRATK